MRKPAHRFVDTLFDGPLDIVGDVHGEHEALGALLDRLGHDPRQDAHPEGRRLVFVGDLVDRGPDSPAVIGIVRDLCERGRAQCVLGNHELNLLRNDRKEGNAWFVCPEHAEQQPGGAFAHSRAVVEAQHKADIVEFLAALPLALQRPDLRVVHAAWKEDALGKLAESGPCSTVELFEHFEADIEQRGRADGLAAKAWEEEQRWAASMTNPQVPVPLLPHLAEWDALRQMGNPLRVLTSGVERAATRPFFSSGKWRMCDRVPWWNEYAQTPRVVVGHYWRQWRKVPGSTHAASKPTLFGNAGPADWLGPQRRVFCVDFSVGARYEERRRQADRFDTALMALRLPEGHLVEDQST